MGVRKPGQGPSPSDEESNAATRVAAELAAEITAWITATNKVLHGHSTPARHPQTSDLNTQGSEAPDAQSGAVRKDESRRTPDTTPQPSRSTLAHADMVAITASDSGNDSPYGISMLESIYDPFSRGEAEAGHALLTDDELGHIAPGCFVRVGYGEESYWVEIGQIEGTMISGMVHHELSSTLCVVNHDSCEVARFRRDQITALGCERYCWC